MAKLTALQIVNGILKNVGEPTVADLTALTGISLLAFDTANEVIHEVAQQYNWQPLEGTFTFTMLTSTNTYAEPTDIMVENINTIRCPDNDDILEILTPPEWDELYPKGVTTATTGYPTKIMRFAGNWHLNKMPSATQNLKIIHGRYFKIPTILATATPTGTCWFPEGSDLTLLVNLATFKVLSYKDNPEAKVYWQRVFGQNGTLAHAVNRWANPPSRVKARVTAIL